MTEPTLSFEKAFERLEEILEKMNSGKISLEDSLKLFEEAETLMRVCNSRLVSAEQKIEQLIKSRTAEVVVDAEMKPKTESFSRQAPPSYSSKSNEELPF